MPKSSLEGLGRRGDPLVSVRLTDWMHHSSTLWRERGGERKPLAGVGGARWETGSLGQPLLLPPLLRSPSAARRWTSLPSPLLMLKEDAGCRKPLAGTCINQ